MRLHSISTVDVQKSIYKSNTNSKINQTNSLQSLQNNIVSFKGRPDHIIFYGAEFPDYDKKGGVANVMSYYEKMPGVESCIVQPYYRGRKDYNGFGQYTGKIEPFKFEENCPYPSLKGQYFYVKFDPDKKNINEETTTNLSNNLKSKNIIVLKKIASKNVIYGKQPEQEIMCFKAMSAEPVIKDGKIVDYDLKELPNDPVTNKKRNHFFIYSKGTAEFRVPYDDGSYSSDKTINPDEFSKYKPRPYAENNRAFVDFKKEICDAVATGNGEKFDAGTVVCSDSQTAYTISFMRDEAIKGNPEFDPQRVTASYVIHNLRLGYTGECGGLDMALNLGLTADEITKLKADPEYIAAEENGTLNEYFAKYIPELKDGAGSFNPTKIAFNIRKSEYMNGLNTVSHGYAMDLANNTNIPTALRDDWKSLVDNHLAIGIMNPFEDPNFHIFKGFLGMNGYLEAGVNEAKQKLNAMGDEFKALADELHPLQKLDSAKFTKTEDGKYTVPEDAYDYFMETKNTYKKEVLNRFTEKFNILKDKDKELYNTIIAGRPNWNVNLIGNIDEKLLEDPERLSKLKVYVSWGRLDSQKSPDIVMDAFDRYCQAHPDEAENSILILGGEAPGTKYSDKTLAQADKMAKKYPGHFSFMEAFAPNKILASIAEMALLPSREAPCELTDIETMQFLALLTATNAQGMADKNFDPDIEEEKDIATSFKTATGYYISEGDINQFKTLGIGDKWKEDKQKLINKIQTEKDNRAASTFATNLDKPVSLKEYVDHNPEHKKAFDDLIDKYRSIILAVGVASCIERANALTKAQRMKIMENQLNLKTGWENNNLLTRLGKSSAELYKDIFRTSANPDKEKYSTSFLHKLREHLNSLANQATPVVPTPPETPITNVSKSFWAKYGKIGAITAASVAIIGGGIYYFVNKSKNDGNVQHNHNHNHHSHNKNAHKHLRTNA